MKRLITFAISLCAAGMTLAAPNIVMLSVTNVSTNATPNTTDVASTPQYLSGWVDSIVFDLTATGVTSPTCTVSIVTVGDTGSGPSRTILAAQNLTADTIKFPRTASQNTSGSTLASTDTCKTPVYQDKIKLSAYAKNSASNFAVKAYIVLCQ